MAERDFEPSRMLWLGPLTILSSIAGVLVTIAIFVFTAIVSSAAARPRRRYRVVAFVALLVSFLPDLLLLRAAPWPPVAVLMAEHAAAWVVTVELLTRIA